jgi:hypothetical protein
MGSFVTHRHATGFVAAAVLLLLLVLPDSDRAEHDSDSPRQLELEPGSDPERHSMSLSKFSQCFTQFVCCNCYKRGASRSIAHFSAPEGQRYCTLGGVRRVGTQERASRQSRNSTDRPSGSWTRRLDPSAGLERDRCAHCRPAAPGMTHRTQYRPNL